MGLLGPSWTWEEIQRKNAIESDIRKENDRVLREQERILKESKPSYNDSNEDYERGQAFSRIASRVKQENKIFRSLYNSYSIANIINKNYLKGLLVLHIKSKNYTTNLRSKGSLYARVLIWGLLFIILRLKFYSWNFIELLLMLFIFFGSLFLIRILPVIINYRKILNNECFNKIKNEIDSESVIEIGIVDYGIRVLYKNKKVDYKFVKYGFNNMPMNIQAVFLATLIQELHLKCNIYLNTIDDGYDNDLFSEQISCNLDELGINAYRKIYFVAMSNEQLKINKNKIKEERKKPNGLNKW